MDIIEITPDTIDLDNLDMPDLNIEEEDNLNLSTQKSTNFGSGIELLMNDKNKFDKKESSNIAVDDITSLEKELNEVSDLEKPEIKSQKKNIFENLFNNDKHNGENVKEVTVNKTDDLGKSTSQLNETKTWDGYSKFNNIPVNVEQTQKPPELTKEEELREKFKYLRKLEELEKKGVSLSKRYNMDSDLQEMIGEYETILAEKEKSNAVKFQGKMLMACITGIEFLNNKFDPFDIKLDGWGEQINENIDDYDEIFGELHEKYKSKAKMSPELKLLFQLGGSAIMVHMSNTLFKSAMPGMDDIMRQNPELMKQFTQAATNTMGKQNPGFGGFMNNIFSQSQNQNQNQPQNNNINMSQFMSGISNFDNNMPNNTNIGPPPPATETKLPERSRRETMIPNRPDIMSAKGINIAQNQGDVNNEERISRPEMNGPSLTNQSDINNLLSGLKTKQINVPNSNQNQNESSTISIDDLKDLTNAKLPSKSKRKQKSDKNIVSLDI
tara:strand:- start:330 stop:1820 length:1491 start_codon:yes stop_codon:yes gene_type:complete